MSRRTIASTNCAGRQEQSGRGVKCFDSAQQKGHASDCEQLRLVYSTLNRWSQPAADWMWWDISCTCRSETRASRCRTSLWICRTREVMERVNINIVGRLAEHQHLARFVR
eukprot:6188178-Pleurochrysis_carterae.AAC.3